MLKLPYYTAYKHYNLFDEEKDCLIQCYLIQMSAVLCPQYHPYLASY